MIRLLKADIYRVLKNRLTLVALILCLAFPLLIVLLYAGMQGLIQFGLEADEEGLLFNANSIIGSVYSLTNNLGLVIPAFAGILVCSDYTNGTLRNKVIAGNRRTEIYLSHLIVSILFSVVLISIYAGSTAGLALIFFPFAKDPSANIFRDILYFVANGTMSFIFMATVSTLFAMILRNIAPTIIFTIVVAVMLMTIGSIVMLIDYEPYKYAVFLIPGFTSNFLNLRPISLVALLSDSVQSSPDIMFLEGMFSYLLFGVLHTVLGLIVFVKRDIK